MTQAVALAQQASTGVSPSFRNRIINGAMVIDQRNAGASVTPVNFAFTVDRWRFYLGQPSKLTCGQNQGAVTPPVGFSNYFGITSSSAYTVGSGEFFLFSQPIEGYNLADLNWGTANAKTVTLSFWLRSSLTGTFGGSVGNGDSTRQYPFSYTISSANTWTQVSITIPGDTTGTWNTTNGGGMYLYFGLGVGSTYSGTAGVWTGSAYYSATGATSVVGTNGATFYITGVQLEVGSTATSFDYRPYGTEFQLCQRYYETSGYGLLGIGNSSTGIVFGYSFQTPKRAAPTVGLYTTSQTWPEIGVANRTSSSVSIGDAALTNIFGTSTRIEGFSGVGTNASLICYTAIAMTYSAEL